MNAADMVIYSGLHLEGQFDAVFAALREQGTLIYTLSKPVKDAGFVIGGFGADETQSGTDDPHFWFDPATGSSPSPTSPKPWPSSIPTTPPPTPPTPRPTMSSSACSSPGPTKACAPYPKHSAT